jgi:hypothetical protein
VRFLALFLLFRFPWFDTHGDLQGRMVTLAPASSIARGEYDLVVSVRELSDGRVLLLERGPKESQLHIVDFERATSQRVGRSGGGPQEFRLLHSLAGIGGDSSVVTDEGLRRWLILHNDSITGMLQASAARPLSYELFGGDRKGSVLSLSGYRYRDQIRMHGTLTADSALALRYSTAGRRTDTIARLRGGQARVQKLHLKVTPTSPRVAYFTVNPLAVGEQALLFGDGWVAVARLTPFRIDWIGPDGERVAGKALPIRLARLSAAKRDSAIVRHFGVGSPPAGSLVLGDWPSHHPPFLQDALLPLRDGHLVIRQYGSASSSPGRYLVVRRGEGFIGIISTPANERIIGFGGRWAYVARTTDEGYVMLQRHPIPVF